MRALAAALIIFVTVSCFCIYIEIYTSDAVKKMNGELERSGLKTTFRRLYESARDEKVMKVKVEVRMIDLAIDDVVMVMEPVELNKSLSMPLEIAGLTLPDMVEKVEYVAFSDDADKQLKLNIDAVVPEFDDSECHMDIVLDPLNIVFPEGVVVDHDRYDGQQLSYNNQSIVGGFSDVVRIEKMYLPEPVGNVLSYSGNVEVTAKAVATGVLNSKSLMSSEKNVSVGIEVKYEPELSDYSVVIADYNYELSDIAPVEIEASLGKDVGEMLKDNTINVSLKQEVPGVNPKILIEIDYPEHDAIRILPAVAGGLKIDFPDLLVFAQSSVEEYGVNTADNSIHFEGDAAIPHSIELEIEKIKVNPEYSEEKDDYLLLDRFEVTGGVRLAGSTIAMKTVQELVAMDVKVGFKAQIPTLAPDKIGMDEYFVSISEKIAIEGMQIELPEMVESIKVSEILLKDVVLDLVVDVESVSEIVGPEAVLTMTADITLPDMLMVEGVGEDGILHMEKSLDAEGRIAFDPVKVVGLNLSGVETVEGKLSVADQEITVNGSISFSNISIDMDELKGKDLEVSIVGSLSSKGEDGVSTSGIDIERIEG